MLPVLRCIDEAGFSHAAARPEAPSAPAPHKHFAQHSRGHRLRARGNRTLPLLRCPYPGLACTAVGPTHTRSRFPRGPLAAGHKSKAYFLCLHLDSQSSTPRAAIRCGTPPALLHGWVLGALPQATAGTCSPSSPSQYRRARALASPEHAHSAAHQHASALSPGLVCSRRKDAAHHALTRGAADTSQLRTQAHRVLLCGCSEAQHSPAPRVSPATIPDLLQQPEPPRMESERGSLPLCDVRTRRELAVHAYAYAYLGVRASPSLATLHGLFTIQRLPSLSSVPHGPSRTNRLPPAQAHREAEDPASPGLGHVLAVSRRFIRALLHGHRPTAIGGCTAMWRLACAGNSIWGVPREKREGEDEDEKGEGRASARGPAGARGPEFCRVVGCVGWAREVRAVWGGADRASDACAPENRAADMPQRRSMVLNGLNARTSIPRRTQTRRYSGETL